MYYVIMIVFVLVMISIISGQSSAPSGTVGGKDCKKCKEDFAWYKSLGKIKKAQNLGWWLLRKAACAANGC